MTNVFYTSFLLYFKALKELIEKKNQRRQDSESSGIASSDESDEDNSNRVDSEEEYLRQ